LDNFNTPRKVCKICKKEKYVDEFHTVGCTRVRKDGTQYRRGYCMECRTIIEVKRLEGVDRSEYMRRYREKNPHKFIATEEVKRRKNAARRAKYNSDKDHRERVKQSVRDYYKNNPDYKKDQKVRAYGITKPEWDQMLKDQDGKCLICGYSDLSVPSFFPVIDHCHATGRVRGLLCTKCNCGIGNLDDSIERMENAIRYLKSQA